MNKKIYKGYELIEAIANKKIKDYTKIIPHYPNNDCTVEYFEYSNGFIHDDKHSDDVNVCIFLKNDRTFEILEDNTEEIEIIKTLYGITEPEIGWKNEGRLIKYLTEIREKVNELVKAVNKMKEGKE